MAGGQVGIEGAWTSGNFGVDVGLKAGIFNNSIETYAFAQQPVGNNLFTPSGSFDEIAYLLEGSIETRYQLTHNTSIYAGYQFLYLDDVALASDQLSQAPITTTPIGSVALTDILYHGVKFGLVVKF